jgi:hypothetical protein
VLLASGLIVGESLLGVVFADAVAFSGNTYPIELVGERFGTASMWLGGVCFALIIWLLYHWVGGLALE